MKRPVIIDTDLTLDDAAAIALAAESEKIDIKAVTLVGENPQLLFNKAKTLCHRLGVNCRIAAGATKPVFKDAFDKKDIYGLYDAAENLQNCEAISCEYPWDIIREAAENSQEQLEIITLGPATNVATALLRYPQIKPLVKSIFVAAGAGYTGNAAPYSEYNAYCDPDALQIIIDSGIPVTLFPLEAADMKNNEYSLDAMKAFLNLQDLQTENYYVRSETRSGENQGWTIIDRLGKYKKEPNISVVAKK